MSNTNSRGEAMPTVNVAINKSRLKTYTKDGKPTYYLKNGTEFQIEVFNPTNGMISARISLNGKKIGQGGLVLRPGERVFLDRYIDIPKKFRFETYEVSDTSEVRKAIENNGDLTVTFHKEYEVPVFYDFNYDKYHRKITPWNEPIHPWNTPSSSNPYTFYCGTTSVSNDMSSSVGTDSFGTASLGLTGALGASEGRGFASSSEPTKSLKRTLRTRTKKVETGRVEEGSHSSQKFSQVHIQFNDIPFKTYEFNILPESTKPITSKEINKRKYCYNCGSKVKSNYKFCPSCGSKA